MGLDAGWLKRIEKSDGATVRGVNVAALGPAPAVAPDLVLVLAAVEAAGYGRAAMEHPFAAAAGRKWRFDACWFGPGGTPGVALERHGGTFARLPCPGCGHVMTRFVSGHHSQKGLEDDAEKLNAAVAMGWAVIVATPPMLADGRALAAVLESLRRRAQP